jgi:CheY-like chemotaxis protein
MDGLEATRELRKHPELHSIPIIAMTANAMDSDRQACLDVGMVDHVSKPIDLQSLVACILRHVAGPANTSGPGLPPIESHSTNTEVSHGGDVPPPHDESPELLDTETALQRLGGDVALYAYVASDFCDAALNHFQTLESEVSASHWNDAIRHAHSLKGLSGTVGANTLSAMSAQIEKLLKAGPTTAATLQLPALRECLEKSVAALRPFAMATQTHTTLAAAPSIETPQDPELAQNLLAWQELLRTGNMRALTDWEAMLPHLRARSFADLDELDRSMKQLDFSAVLEQGGPIIDWAAGHKERPTL